MTKFFKKYFRKLKYLILMIVHAQKKKSFLYQGIWGLLILGLNQN